METSTTEATEKQSLLTEMTASQMVQTILAGFVAGAVAGGLTLVFSAYLFKVLPCAGQACGTGGQYAAVLASIISGATALFWLIRIQIFRPLLVVLAVTVSLWGIELMMLGWPWYNMVIVSAGLHAAAYVLFVWLARLRFFWLVLLLIVGLVVAARYILAS